MSVSRSASISPNIGESTMAAAVLPSPVHTIAPSPAFAVPAPTRPPISACDELDGMPSPQVIRFHTIAPISAPNTTRGSMTSAVTMPTPMVCATCSPKNRNAMKLKNAAQATAYCGRSTRVDTMVAIEFAASCRPLRKSKISATAISATSSGNTSAASFIVARFSGSCDLSAHDLIRKPVPAFRDHALTHGR